MKWTVMKTGKSGVIRWLVPMRVYKRRLVGEGRGIPFSEYLTLKTQPDVAYTVYYC